MAKILKAVNMNKCIGCFTCMHICAGVNRNNNALSQSAISVKTTGGMGGKFIAHVCLACNDERACAQACPEGALAPRKGGGVILNKEKCTGCGKCIAACIVDAIHFDFPEDKEKRKPIICIHCGMCAKFCPHDCLAMVEVAE